jgi:sugar phosphate isomerase/epimerase
MKATRFGASSLIAPKSKYARAVEICLFSSALPCWEPARVAAAARAVGLDAVEWGIGPGQPLESARAAARVLRHVDIQAAGVCVQGGAASLGTPARLTPFVALAAELRAPHLRVFAPALRAGAQERARDGAARAAKLAAARGVTVLVEMSPGTIAPSTSQARALVDGFPPERLSVLYDPGNTVIEGHIEPKLAVAELGPYLRHVHVKNIAWRRVEGAWSWRHADLDTGLLDWRVVLTALRHAGYRGRLSLDHLGGKPTLALLRREVEFLRGLLSS